MTTEILCSGIAAFSAIMVAAINSRMAKAAKRAEEHAGIRSEESLLQMKQVNAIGELCLCIARALRESNIANGNVKSGMEAVTLASESYNDFLRKTTAGQVGA